MFESEAVKYMKTLQRMTVVMVNVYEKQVLASLEQMNTMDFNMIKKEMEELCGELHQLRKHMERICGFIKKYDLQKTSCP